MSSATSIVEMANSNVTGRDEFFHLSTEVDAKRRLITIMIYVELFFFCLIFPLSLYVVRTMFTTCIIHLNLRLLFTWHSLSAMISVAGRSYCDVVNLFIPDSQFPYVAPTIPEFLARFGVVTNVLVTPIPVVERIIATRQVRSYENSAGSHYFLYMLMLLVLALAVLATLSDTANQLYSYRFFNPATMIFYLVSTAASVLAYAQSENIRASRQLLPILLLHVLQNIPLCVFIYLAYIGKITGPLDYITYTSLIGPSFGLIYFGLQFSIIRFHPILYRKALEDVRRWSGCGLRLCGITNRVIPTNTGDFASSNEVAVIHCKLKTINGQELIPHVEDKRAEHFQNLAMYWEKNDPHNTLGSKEMRNARDLFSKDGVV